MLRILTLSTLCAALAAQATPSPFRFVPKDSCLVVRMAAPAVWQQRFAKTQIVKLLRANTLAPLVDQASAAFDGALGKLRESGKFDASLVEKLLADYRGEVVFSVQVDWDRFAAAMQDDGKPPVSFVLALSPDASYDLAALGSALEKLIEAEGGSPEPIRDLVVGDHRLRIGGDEDFQATLPAIIDGHLVMLGGAHLEQQAARLLADKDRFDGHDGKAPLSVQLRLDRMLTTVLEMAGHELEANTQLPFDFAQMVHDLGVNSLQDFELTIDAHEKSVAIDYELGLNDKERGLLGCFAFEHARPKLLRFVPPAADQFSAVPIDFAAFYRVVEKIWTGLGDEVPLKFDDAMKTVAEHLKVRLKEDLLDRLGDEMLLLQDSEAVVAGASDPDDPTAGMGGMCLAISLRDGKAFGEALETALRSRGLHAARKSEDYAGTKIYTLKIAAVFEIEYAITGDLALLAFGKGEASHRNLRGVLDARSAEGDTDAVPMAAKAHIQQLPAGWNGLGVTNMAAMLRSYEQAVEAMKNMDIDLPPEVSMVLKVLASVGGDLQRLGMQSMTSASYATPRKIGVRMRW
ncbi:MAG TPA: hypothetical protein VFZ65_23515 [Planctomycetota bacterium]|nr:hypothetical protein [Planctomycetota bacterium]